MAMHTWPENLILDIYGSKPESQAGEPLIFSDEAVDAIEKILKSHLCAVELQVLCDLYRDGLSVSQTAKRHAHTEEGIWQIQTACIDFLRRPGFRKELQDCLDTIVKRKDRSDSLADWNLSPRAFNLLARANIFTVQQLCAMNRNDIFMLPGCGKVILKELENFLLTYFPNENHFSSEQYIAESSLSARAKRILRRMEIYTVPQLLALNQEQRERVTTIRNCGETTRQEILAFIRENEKEVLFP